MNYYFDVLKKYGVFQGRARRKEYWMYVLGNFIVLIVLEILQGIGRDSSIGSVMAIIIFAYVVATIIPSIAVGARRLHDTGRSGWWLLIALVPFIGAIVIIVFTVMDSQPGDNQYGPNPKA